MIRFLLLLYLQYLIILVDWHLILNLGNRSSKKGNYSAPGYSNILKSTIMRKQYYVLTQNPAEHYISNVVDYDWEGFLYFIF